MQKLMNKFVKANSKTFQLIMLAALLLVILRGAVPFRVGGDQGVQLEGAYRLSEGFGLKIMGVIGETKNLNVSPKPKSSISFTPGVSLLIAGTLLMGFSLASSLKILYGITTLVGWVGWTLIGGHFLTKGIIIYRRNFPLHHIIALLLPIFYTPAWSGSDIFLWAIAPFIVLLLTNSGKNESTKKSNLVMAGVFFGFSYFMRNASLVLGVLGFLIIFYQSYSCMRSLFVSVFLFFISSLLFIVPISLFNMTVEGTPLPSWVHFNLNVSLLSKSMSAILSSWSNISYLFGFPLLATITPSFVEILKMNSFINVSFGVFCFILLLSLPIFFAVKYRSENEREKKALAISLTFVPISCVIFLSSAMYFISHRIDFLGIPREYSIAVPANIFIIYELCCIKKERKTIFFIEIVPFLLVFLIWIISAKPILQKIEEKVSNITIPRLAMPVFGYIPKESFQISDTIENVYENSFLKIKQLLHNNPKAIIYTSHASFFRYDSIIRIRSFPNDVNFLEGAYVEQGVEVYFVFFSNWREMYEKPVVDIISSLPDLKVLVEYEEKGEGLLPTRMVILKSYLPDGYRISKK